MNHHQQETLPGTPEKKLDFFQGIRRLQIKSDATMALILTIMPNNTNSMSSQKIRKKIRTSKNKNKIKVVETLSPVFSKMQQFDLIKKVPNHHAYSLTDYGMEIADSRDRILRFFIPPEPKQLTEQTGQRSVINNPEERIKTLEILRDTMKDTIKQRDYTIEKLEEEVNKNKNILGQYKKIVDYMAKTYKKYGAPGNAVGDQTIALLIDLQSGLNTSTRFLCATRSFFENHETKISEATKLSTEGK